MDEIR